MEMEERARLTVSGIVQGVGFRPFLHRLAGELDLTGFVANNGVGVICEVQGAADAVHRFTARLVGDAPPLARIDVVDVTELEVVPHETAFVIAASAVGADARLAVPADVAPCPACVAEFTDPDDRRFGYPFTCCVDCGPRYTVVAALPYDRERTSMAPFPLCPTCRTEYEDPHDRRFHAQATCCPTCGPELELHDLVAPDAPASTGEGALVDAVAALIDGRIVAVKGLGGFQLMCRADDEGTVARLRSRKARIGKPFALLAPTVEAGAAIVTVDDATRAALTDPAAPIVLAPRRPDAAVATAVAPHHSTLGVMLPSTPLHHLLAHRLFAETGAAAVCTSGNRSDEPMVVDDARVATDLAGIADLVLGHDRRIKRRADDSVGHIVGDRFQLLRRARGYAPASIRLGGRGGASVLAVGAELKNTVGVAVGDEALLSMHLGDLEHPAALRAFEMAVTDLLDLVGGSVDLVVHDLHPEYLSTKFALAADVAPTVAVQHHHAHLVSCLVDNGHDGRAIGVTFDGLGWGSDGALWGGEFLLGDATGFERVAHLVPVPMPDGAAAIREPWRMAIHHLRAAGLPIPPVGWLADPDRRLPTAGSSTMNTTSMGRLFDAIGSLCGVVGGDVARHEGQTAIQLEQLAEAAPPSADDTDRYPVTVVRSRSDDGAPVVIEVQDLLASVVADLTNGVAPSAVAARFHRWAADVVVMVCDGLRRHEIDTVALTGGVFQNRLLTALVRPELTAAGFEVLVHHRVPANDGGISLGQLAIARAMAASPATGTMGS